MEPAIARDTGESMQWRIRVFTLYVLHAGGKVPAEIKGQLISADVTGPDKFNLLLTTTLESQLFTNSFIAFQAMQEVGQHLRKSVETKMKEEEEDRVSIKQVEEEEEDQCTEETGLGDRGGLLCYVVKGHFHL